MERTIGTIRTFKTANFSVVVDALEDFDIDLLFDETGEVRKKLDSGEIIAFTARAICYYQGAELAADYLGGCIYTDLEDFADHRECGKQNREYAAKGEHVQCGSYFKGMVKTVIYEARKEIKRIQAVKLRA